MGKQITLLDLIREMDLEQTSDIEPMTDEEIDEMSDK